MCLFWGDMVGITLSARVVTRKLNLFNLITLILLVLFSINYQGVGHYIPIIFTPLAINFLFRNSFTNTFWYTVSSLFLYSIFHSLIMYGHEMITVGVILRYILFPLTMLIVGYMLVKKNHKKVTFYLLIIIVSNVLFGFLSVMYSQNLYGEVRPEYRVVVDVWDQTITSTLLNASLSFGLVLLPLIFLNDKLQKNNIKIRIISVICFVLSFYSIMKLGNRTGFALIIVAIVLSFFFTTKLNASAIVKGLLVMLFVAFSQFMYFKNALNIRTNWESSLLFSRLNSSSPLDDPRIDAWKKAFMGVFKNPIGGREADIGLNYAHNMWLDIGLDSGVFPLIFIVLFTLFGVGSLFSLLKNKAPLMVKRLFLLLFVAFLLIMCFEPVMTGVFSFFVSYCFVVGMLQGYNAHSDNTAT